MFLFAVVVLSVVPQSALKLPVKCIYVSAERLLFCFHSPVVLGDPLAQNTTAKRKTKTKREGEREKED